MAEVFACLVYVLDGSTVSIDVNVSIVCITKKFYLLLIYLTKGVFLTERKWPTTHKGPDFQFVLFGN